MTDEEPWEDINEQVRAEWKAETTPFERVYEVLEQTHDGESAAVIADRALVSEPTARKHCKTLVEAGLAETTQDGVTTLYSRNDDRHLQARIDELRRDTTREELLEVIQRMKADIHEYEQRHDAVSPEELARQLPTDATDEWETVSEWKTTQQNLAVAQAALAYDEASDALAA
jgi:predicted ArsR family transcriptional regulator